jgi:hypothetical protein
LGVGILVALLASRVVVTMLFGVGAFEGVSYASAVIVVCVAALAADGMPAARAARVDPLLAMHSDG